MNVLPQYQIQAALLAALILNPAGAQESKPQAETTEPTTVTVKGRVTDPQDSPLASAGVILRPIDELITADALKQPDTRSDEQGRFELQLDVKQPGARPVLHVAARDWAAVIVHVSPVQKDGKYEPVVDVGDIALLPGTRIFGRVRDTDGNPLAGVRIIATDMFKSSRVLRINTKHAARSSAVSGADGIFSLPSALPQALKVEFTTDGYYHRTLHAVSRQTPLEVRLQESGYVRGRVLDERGSPLSTTVTATYEVAGSASTTKSGEDGSFRLPLAHAARYRLTAQTPSGNSLTSKKTGILFGPQENLEIVLEAREPVVNTTGKLLIRAVDVATGKPIEKFRASVGWNNQGQNDNYLAYYIFARTWSSTDSNEGVVNLSGPSPRQPQLGWVHVRAPGFAPTTLREVEWDEEAVGAGPALNTDEAEVAGKQKPGTEAMGDDAPPSKTVAVEMVVESRLTGTVVDERTGKPVAGVKLWAVPQQDRSQGYYGGVYTSAPPKHAITSRDDGKFDLGELAEGAWDVLAHHPDRPRHRVPVTLDKAEHKQGFTVEMPPGARVAGRLVGAKIGRGWQVQLFRLPKVRRSGIYNYNNQTKTAPVKADGSFAFEGLELESYMLGVLIPTGDRGGQPQYLSIEPFRVRAEGIDREFDLSADLLGSLTGRVKLTGTPVPMDRLVVVALEIQEGQNIMFNPYNVNYQGPRAFVRTDGGFSLRLTPGQHQLQLVDFATGVRLAISDPIIVRSRRETTTEIATELVEIKVRLEKESEDVERIVADRLEMRVSPKQKEGAAGGVIFGGNDSYDTGVGLPLEVGQTELSVVVPPSQITFFVRNEAWRILEGVPHNEARAPLGRLEYDTEEHEGKAAVIPVTAPLTGEEGGAAPADVQDAVELQVKKR